MVSIIYIMLLSMTLWFIFLWCRCRASKGKIPTNWPIVGMTPSLLVNLHRIHDFLADLLIASGGTFMFKGPWFANVDMLMTCDPANVHHMLCKKFPNYGKGPQFKKIFAALGDGIFIAEAESWEFQRKAIHTILHHKGFVNFMVTSTWNKVQKGMIPLLDHVAKLGIDVDFQELTQRFSFDLTFVLLLDDDPLSLSIEFPDFPFRQALTEADEAILYRHALPETIWKLQRWFHIGKEKNLRKALDIADPMLADKIGTKREKLKNMDNNLSFQEGGFDFMTGYMKILGEKSGASDIPDKIWRDTLLNLIFAGKETVGVALTWFFWLIAENPVEENKILEEIIRNSNEHKEGWLSFAKVEELDKLTYLHGALCETLRLFSPVPLQHKAPIEADILPSGHHLKPNTKTILSFYSMGRMEQIWGKDCLEFKPSRWISERGGIKNVPSFKFTAFNAGPKSCLGKEMSFIQMKMIAAALMYHFEFKVVEGQNILPTGSIILHMKNDLMVRVSKRATSHSSLEPPLPHKKKAFIF